VVWWKDNIKMDLQEIKRRVVECIYVGEVTDQ
jgi:hypothetical protein